MIEEYLSQNESKTKAPFHQTPYASLVASGIHNRHISPSNDLVAQARLNALRDHTYTLSPIHFRAFL